MRGGDTICLEEGSVVGVGEVSEGVHVAFTGGELAGECEMLCRKPFARVASGVKPAHLLSESGRLAHTMFGCGQCLACRINKARVWTVRILMENELHNESYFIGLTYSDVHLPEEGVVKKHIQDFMKKFRNRTEDAVRFFAVGEYGDIGDRPHYHVMLFGDRLGVSSEKIAKCWNMGNHHIGTVTRFSARYIAGYTLKNLGKGGRSDGRNREFMICSRRPGIGRGYVEKIAQGVEKHRGCDVRTIRIGGKVYPYGRYIQEKLDEVLEVDESVIAKRLYDYQSEQFGDYGECKNVIVEHEDRNKTKFRQQEKRFRIYKQRREL